ncbi:MAG: SusC/RagA family TonB-linked outer membrane protein [Prevotella sp.]
MKKLAKHYSGIRFTNATMAVGLTALLCMPLQANAEETQATTPVAQAVQQNRTVKGQVVDETGEPMIGVTVRVKATGKGTITDMDGNFSIQAAPNAIIEISFVGYKTQTFKASKTSYQLKMELDNTGLDEVVVIGYGTQKKRDLTGAVSSVKAEDIKQAPVMNAMEGLQGKISGLDITRTSGQAGSTPEILLRGNRSLNASSAPLFVIDGVTGGSINDLNPNDIESIEVLKDASSTAIYGSAGANGVIIVTTKQGSKGKVQVDFDAYVGINAFPSYPSTLSGQSWIDFLTEGYVARYDKQPENIDELFNAAGLSQGALDAYNNNKWVDWKDEILHTGVQQNYHVSVRGGNEKHQSYVSAGYQQEKGLYKNDQVDMLTFRAGTTYNINNVLTVGYQSTLSYRNQEKRNSRLSKSLNQIPLGEAYDENGNLNKYPISDMNSYINILADDEMDAYRNNTKSTAITISPFVEIKPFKGFSLRSMFSASLSHSRNGLWDGLDTYMKLSGSAENKRIASYKSSNSWNYLWQNIANYNFKIKEDHDITLTGIIEYSKNTYDESFAQNEQFEYDDFLWYNLSAGLKAAVSSAYKETAKMSYAVRVNYSYLGRYLLSASTRWDGASQLYNKWCAFPAFSAGWRISDEPFMNGTKKWLDNLKLRVGYGVTGNANIDPYVTLTAVTNSANYLNLGSGQLQSYILARNVANSELTWEKSYNWNFGLDFSVLNRRIDGSIELYTTDTKGVLYNRPLPTSFGGFNAKQPYYKMSNIARIKNKGVEITLNSRNIVKKNFRWNSTFTFAKNVEKLKEIDLGNNVTVKDLIALNLFLDNPVNTYYGYKKEGIWQLGQEDMAACFDAEPGQVRIEVPELVYDPTYTYTITNPDTGEEKTYIGAYYKPSEDAEDGTHKYYTKSNPYTVSANDKQILGSKTPDWTIGFHNTFEFYNFDISIMATMRWGQMVNGELLGYSSKINQPDCYDYWTPDNPTNAYPRPNFGGGMTDAQKESMRYVDGSFIKIKNITVGYTLPKNVLKKMSMTKLRVYATITNPFIWSKSEMLDGMDPENNASDSFPLYKTLVFGINASF